MKNKNKEKANRKQKNNTDTYPRRVRIEEAPPHAVLAHLLHTTASIQKGGQHALTQLNDTNILLGLCGFGRVVGDGVFLGYRRDDERRVQVDQRLP